MLKSLLQQNQEINIKTTEVNRHEQQCWDMLLDWRPGKDSLETFTSITSTKWS